MPVQLLMEIRTTQGSKTEKGVKIARKSSVVEIFVYYNCGDSTLAGNYDTGGYKFVFALSDGLPTDKWVKMSLSGDCIIYVHAYEHATVYVCTCVHTYLFEDMSV